jgi:hypothetical protein
MIEPDEALTSRFKPSEVREIPTTGAGGTVDDGRVYCIEDGADIVAEFVSPFIANTWTREA